MKLPVGPSDYYELFPSGDHQSGDIWTDLPTHGVLADARLPCVVITPACDLVNRKVETVTYLPILGVGTYLTSRSHLPEILRTINGQLKACGLEITNGEYFETSFPRLEDVQRIKNLWAEYSLGRLNAKQKTAAERAGAGLGAIMEMFAGNRNVSLVQNLKTLFGEKDFAATARKLVTNSHRTDLHFLPDDGQVKAWTIIGEPSIALFRYPLSIPIDVLDLAQTVSESSWGTEVVRLRAFYPCVDALTTSRPLKALRIRPRIMSDLLTRFTALYGRLGSPDFTDGTIDRYVNQIEGLT